MVMALLSQGDAQLLSIIDVLTWSLFSGPDIVNQGWCQRHRTGAELHVFVSVACLETLSHFNLPAIIPEFLDLSFLLLS